MRRLFFSEFVYNSFVKPWTKYLFCWTKAELFVFLFLFFWPLYCLSFVELRLLITPLLSSNCSYVKQQTSNHSFSPKNSFPLRLGPSWSYDSWIYNYICNQCISPLTLWVRISRRRGVLDTTLCDKVCQCLATDRWFSLGTLASFTNKTDRHDITEILLNVLLNTILPFTVGCIMYPNALIFLEVHKVVCRRFQYAKTKTLKEKYKVNNLDLWCYVTQWIDSFFDPHPQKKPKTKTKLMYTT